MAPETAAPDVVDLEEANRTDLAALHVARLDAFVRAAASSRAGTPAGPKSSAQTDERPDHVLATVDEAAHDSGGRGNNRPTRTPPLLAVGLGAGACGSPGPAAAEQYAERDRLDGERVANPTLEPATALSQLAAFPTAPTPVTFSAPAVPDAQTIAEPLSPARGSASALPFPAAITFSDPDGSAEPSPVGTPDGMGQPSVAAQPPQFAEPSPVREATDVTQPSPVTESVAVPDTSPMPDPLAGPKPHRETGTAGAHLAAPLLASAAAPLVTPAVPVAVPELVPVYRALSPWRGTPATRCRRLPTEHLPLVLRR